VTDSEHPVDAIVRVRFLLRAEGGLERDVAGPSVRATIVVGGVYSSCQLYSGSGLIQLGHMYEFGIAFAAPNVIRPLVHPGTEFTLSAGRTIAQGSVVRLVGGNEDKPCAWR